MRWIAKHFYSPVIPWRLMGGLFLSVVIFTVYYSLQFTSKAQPTHPDASIYTLAIVGTIYAFTLSLLCFKGQRQNFAFFFAHLGGKRSRKHKRECSPTHPTLCFSPILLGLCLAIFGLGEMAWIMGMLISGQLRPYPAIPEDFINFGIYPFLIWAILLLPARTLSRLSRGRIFLDGLLIMSAITTLAYYFMLAPLLVYGAGSYAAKVVGNLYITADFVLMLCFLLVVLRSGERSLAPALVLLGCAVVTLFLTHTLHIYETLDRGYNDFSAANLGWPITGIFTVGAACTVTNILKSGQFAEQGARKGTGRVEVVFSDRRWKAALPAIFVLVFTLLIVATWLNSSVESFPNQRMIIYSGGFAVLILMVLRQLLTLYEVGALQRQLQVKNRSLSLLNTHLEEQATRDALTGLPNHRSVVEKLDEVLTNARGTQGSCSVVFIDIDEFKSINDLYGHLIGDTVLTNFSKVMETGLRAGDYVGRWGGEEFVVILPDTEPLEALNLAEGLRKRIEQHVLAGNGEIKVTCSLGVASYPQDATGREELITQADEAMYAAKQLGRNQTRSAHEPLVQALRSARPASEIVAHAEGQAMIEVLLASLAARDPATVQHMRRVGALSLKLAQALGLNNNEAHLVSLGGLLHDLGKLAIPDAILNKQNGLNEAERATILQHPITGAALLQPIHALQAAAPIVRTHHEQLNGQGYPDGLRGDEIPLATRIVTVADVYDALTSERPYHTPKSPSEALRILQKGAGTHFDPRVLKTLAGLLTTSAHLSEVA